jgi:hypothetical protein
VTCNHCATASTGLAAHTGSPDIESAWAANRGHGQQCPQCGQFMRADGGHSCPEKKPQFNYEGELAAMVVRLQAERIADVMDMARMLVTQEQYNAAYHEFVGDEAPSLPEMEHPLQGTIAAMLVVLENREGEIAAKNEALKIGKKAVSPEALSVAQEEMDEDNESEPDFDPVSSLNEFATIDFDGWRETCSPRTDETGQPKLYNPDHDDEWAIVQATDPKCVWTLCEEDDIEYATPGFHLVNRLGYYVCDKPVPHFNMQAEFTTGEEFLDRVFDNVSETVEARAMGEEIDREDIETMAEALERAIDMNDGQPETPQIRTAKRVLEMLRNMADDDTESDSDDWEDVSQAMQAEGASGSDAIQPPPFNDTEMGEIFEFARLGLADADNFDRIAEESDLSDEYLSGLRDKLQTWMDNSDAGAPPFNDTEMGEIFELARLGLADADNFDQIAEESDLSDEYLQGLRDKVQAWMDGEATRNQVADRNPGGKK